MKISVVTATLNSASFLGACIEGVADQGGVEFEHILVDGGSSDATLEIARKYPHIIIVERPGCGIYEAWNIGIAAASGNWIGFCNSDDFYAPDTFQRVAEAVRERPEIWLVSGTAIQFRNDSEGRSVKIREYADPPSDRLRFETLDVFGPAPNARFLSRKLFDHIGVFDTSYRLCADCSFLMKAALADLPAATIADIVYHYRSHPGSTTLGGRIDTLALTLDEKLRIATTFLREAHLNTAQRHHLFDAMSRQLASTVWANFDAGLYGSAMTVLLRIRNFPVAAFWLLSRHLVPVFGVPIKRALLRLAGGARKGANRANRC